MKNLTLVFKMVTQMSLGLLAVASFSLSAHESAMDNNWCANGQIVTVSETTLTYKLLATYEQKVASCEVVNENKSCGLFDDDYGVARSAGHNVCNSMKSLLGIHADIQTIWHSPASFNDSAQHHQTYSKNNGVTFSCAICIENTSVKKK